MQAIYVKHKKKNDVTIDITSNTCYTSTIRCNNKCYNKNINGGNDYDKQRKGIRTY